MKAPVLVCLAALAMLLIARPAAARDLYFGADMSFANEMDDCGVVYREDGKPVDVYALFKEHGANVARVRIWTDGNPTRYSNLADVTRSLVRAKAQGMKTLLDFHYSDWWADGGKQVIPKAWADIKDPQKLADTLYHYTYDTLMALNKAGVMPDIVQPGNEINHEILEPAAWRRGGIDWARNALLLNAAIKAIRDAGRAAGTNPKILIQIAQPENTLPWFDAAAKAGVSDFDMIGISYYPKWSLESFNGLGRTINLLRSTYPGKEVLVVETAYPWTDGSDRWQRQLAEDNLTPGFPTTPEGQRNFLVYLSQTVIANGGVGVFTWAPDWLPGECRTPHSVDWSVMGFFDGKGNVLPAIDYMKYPYKLPVTVTFRLHGAKADKSYALWGDFFGNPDGTAFPMTKAGGDAVYRVTLMPGTALRFQIYDDAAMEDAQLDGNKQDGDMVPETVPDTDTSFDFDAR